MITIWKDSIIHYLFNVTLLYTFITNDLCHKFIIIQYNLEILIDERFEILLRTTEFDIQTKIVNFFRNISTNDYILSTNHYKYLSVFKFHFSGIHSQQSICQFIKLN